MDWGGCAEVENLRTPDMKFLTLAALAVATAMTGQMAKAETGLSALFKREQSTLNSVPGSRLSSFLGFKIRPKTTAPEDITFTKSWLAEQPVATGEKTSPAWPKPSTLRRAVRPSKASLQWLK